jgi:hypothetical protein
MRSILNWAVVIAVFACGCAKQVTKVTYPEKFEGLTQLVLASESKVMSFTDTTVSKILGFKLASSQATVTSSVTYDFYLDFDKDGYTMAFNSTGDTLNFNAPPLKVKKPIINDTKVTYPEKNFLINAEAQAVKKLETLTEEFTPEGQRLLNEPYVRSKCEEMLRTYLLDLTKKMSYQVKKINITFLKPAA